MARSKHPLGTFNWFECGSTDQAKAKAFYTQVFGWETADVPMPQTPPGMQSPVQAPVRNVGTPRSDAVGRGLAWSARGRPPSSGNCKGQRTEAGHRDGPARSSGEAW